MSYNLSINTWEEFIHEHFETKRFTTRLQIKMKSLAELTISTYYEQKCPENENAILYSEFWTVTFCKKLLYYL